MSCHRRTAGKWPRESVGPVLFEVVAVLMAKFQLAKTGSKRAETGSHSRFSWHMLRVKTMFPNKGRARTVASSSGQGQLPVKNFTGVSLE